MRGKSIKPFIVIISSVFIISSIIGYYVPVHLQQGIARDLSTFFAPFKTLSPGKIFLFIFFNNSVKSLVAILFGFIFGLVPLLFITGNGYILGLILSFSIAHMSIGEIALRILPHGIFEIPAFLMAGSYGLLLGVRFYRKLRYKEPFKDFLVLSLKKFALIIEPLLLIAAFIETFVTPSLIGFAT